MGKKTKWDEMFDKASERMSQWRRENSQASFSAIEKEVDGELARLRAQMIQDLALESSLADIRGSKAGEKVKCPECGTEVKANGQEKRRLVTDYEEEIELERSKAKCPGCGVSFFPPG
jgi:predicted RNA-binding Zn-ribbon protein involved in translation (DUF1610 family)